jgi:hydrogenase nickel incorporation protein HypB
MCKECGCGKPGNFVAAPSPKPGPLRGDTKIIRLEQRVLAENEDAAQRNRKLLHARGIFTLNLISSPGSGKTALLERTLDVLKGKLSCAVITGDQQTDNDAKRLANRGAPVVQITTGNACHLDAQTIAEALPKVLTDDTRMLLIENVGNLICPAAFDLGEDLKVALLSVTEGEDKPLKYPVIFSLARLVVITKIDLAPHVDWDRQKCLDNIRQVSPHAKIVELSSKTGEGFQAWADFLQKPGVVGR